MVGNSIRDAVSGVQERIQSHMMTGQGHGIEHGKNGEEQAKVLEIIDPSTDSRKEEVTDACE